MGPFVISFVLWAALHSLTAASGPKSVVRRLMGEHAYEGLYRLAYNLFSLVTFLPILYLLATQVPKTPLWAIPRPFNLLANLLQLAGLLGLAISLLQTDIWDFAGLRQAMQFLSNNPHPTAPPKLVTGGTYALVRHPLYFFSLIVLWFNPVVTLDVFIFNVLSTLYFGIGSRYEEKRLETFFGDAYRQYKRRVPYLLPLKLPGSPGSAAEPE